MKPLCVVSCPIDTFSGYGARSRDFVKSLIQLKGEEWIIQILPQRWGNTSWGYIEENKDKWGFLESHLLKLPQLPKQPEVWIQITVPNEFQPIGKYNIGVTAGIETTVCDGSWIEGCNRMNLVLASSEHSKKIFESSKFQKLDSRTNQPVGVLELTSPIEVLFEGVDLDIYKKIDKLVDVNLDNDLNNLIEEDFAFLFCGHWLQGELGQDRKDVGMLVKVFLEVFKNKKKRPALILKTSGATSSIMDKEDILKKIDAIRKTCKGDLPNVYILHGELDGYSVNDLYNHSKIKAMVSFTKGEGFGRPLLEFSLTQKPIIASGWSGHIDFLNKDFSVLVEGKLNKIHPTAVVQNMLLAESEWFTIDYSKAGGTMRDMFENYKNYTEGGKRQAHYSKTRFSLEKMTDLLNEVLTARLPEFPKPVQLKLPQLKKIELPKLKKTEIEPTQKSDSYGC